MVHTGYAPKGLMEQLSNTSSSLGVVDPMCGSGTLLLEAALMAHGIAPGVVREALHPSPQAGSARQFRQRRRTLTGLKII
eukprot:2618867-Amphidinium_carterae.1